MEGESGFGVTLILEASGGGGEGRRIPNLSGTHVSTNPTTSTVTHMTQCYTIDTTTAPLPVLPWYQNLPLTIYFYDAGRPGPPWPPPTHNNKLLCILSMSDTNDTLSILPGFQQNPTDIQPSKTICNKQLHPMDPTKADWTQLQADKIRAKLHTHAI